MILISTADQVNATENDKTTVCRQHQLQGEEGRTRGQGIGVLPYVKDDPKPRQGSLITLIQCVHSSKTSQQ